jgi:hypothetical protein
MDEQTRKKYFDFNASDERMHTPGPEPEWNESMLFHMVELGGERGLLLRIGRRVNEGHAEVTVSQLFADGSIAVNIFREPISDNLAPSAGGLEFHLVEPLKQWRCTYQGIARILKDGRDLKNPKNLGTAPKQAWRIDLQYQDLIPVFAAAPGGSYVSAETINQRHYEGIAAVSGTVTLGKNTAQVRGFGFRDHSWGVRKWHSIDYWRWCYGQRDADNIFSVCRLQASGQTQISGVILRKGKLALPVLVWVISTVLMGWKPCKKGVCV